MLIFVLLKIVHLYEPSSNLLFFHISQPEWHLAAGWDMCVLSGHKRNRRLSKIRNLVVSWGSSVESGNQKNKYKKMDKTLAYILCFWAFTQQSCTNEASQKLDCSKCVLEEIWNDKTTLNHQTINSSHSLDAELTGEVRLEDMVKKLFNLEANAGIKYGYNNSDSVTQFQKNELHTQLDPLYLQKYQTARNLFCAKCQSICMNPSLPDSIKYLKYYEELEKLTTDLSNTLEKFQKKDENNKYNNKIKNASKLDSVTITLKGNYDHSLQNLTIKVNEKPVSFHCNFPNKEASFRAIEAPPKNWTVK
jgi:hypothetical protein